MGFTLRIHHRTGNAHQELSQHIYIPANRIYIQLQRLQQRQLSVIRVTYIVTGHPSAHAAKCFDASVQRVFCSSDVR